MGGSIARERIPVCSIWVPAMTPAESAGRRMDEVRATAAFRRWLTAQGWIVEPAGRGSADVVASRGTQQLIGEVKGHTGDPGTDLDTAYGQLLRRMSHGGPEIRYALIVPISICRHTERVPASIRQIMR
ncbi:hypothetical protein [Nonomuraea sp. JJY05]|uniref:hypothetical protein n=1 Tax=Nonomuraea sp. JJY05 TaxID=3350255 RepID=UPI00373E12F8